MDKRQCSPLLPAPSPVLPVSEKISAPRLSSQPCLYPPAPETRQSGLQAGYISALSVHCPRLSLPRLLPYVFLLCFPCVSAPHISSCRLWLSCWVEGSPFGYWYPPDAPWQRPRPDSG